jgi:phosphate starvation-inducible PhoH-like protein
MRLGFLLSSMLFIRPLLAKDLSSLYSSTSLLPSFSTMPMSTPSKKLAKNDNGKKDNAKNAKKNKGPSLYLPRTEHQQTYLDRLQNKTTSLVIAHGPAGTGKTLFACMEAAESLKRGDVTKIVLTRPMIPVDDEEFGFLPGNLMSKMEPWTRPMFDIFCEFFSFAELMSMVQKGVIEVSPLAFMRGRTFHQSFVLADEMQNSSPSQMKMLATRIGQNSKLVVMGDLLQSDRSQSVNGLEDFLGKLNSYQSTFAVPEIDVIHMDERDVSRSSLVTRIVDIYDRKKDPVSYDLVRTDLVRNDMIRQADL